MGWFWSSSAGALEEKQSSTPKCPVDHTKLSGCPVNHDGKSPFSSSSSRNTTSQSSGCPVNHDGKSSFSSSSSQNTSSQSSGCPVDHETRSRFSWFSKPSGPDANNNEINPLNNMPNLSSLRAPGQTVDLPTERTFSTIPRGETSDQGVWEYPSPQQMYNAMLRKGGGEIPEDAVESMVDVHNFLNEGAWDEILKWEAPYTQDTKNQPRLLKFTGRPNDMTPRAAILQLLGMVYPSKYAIPVPFDRHDWTVLRADKSGQWQKVRYVIDYYSSDDDEHGNPAFVLDVRPALDSVSSAVDRFNYWSGSVFHKALGLQQPYK